MVGPSRRPQLQEHGGKKKKQRGNELEQQRNRSSNTAINEADKEVKVRERARQRRMKKN